VTRKKIDHNTKTFKTRPIVHPKFQNLSTDDAIKVIVCISCKRPDPVIWDKFFRDGDRKILNS
jgi:hypothetical protein